MKNNDDEFKVTFLFFFIIVLYAIIFIAEVCFS